MNELSFDQEGHFCHHLATDFFQINFLFFFVVGYVEERPW